MMGRWTSVDPIGHEDQSNLYAYVKNNPQSRIDPYGLYSMEEFFTGSESIAKRIIYRLADGASRLGPVLATELGLSDEVQKKIDEFVSGYLGGMAKLYGAKLEQSSFGVIGQGEISDKVRITLINGILTHYEGHIENAN